MDRIRQLLNTDYAYKRGYTGRNVTVAVMDTGLYPHKDVKQRILNFYDTYQHQVSPYDDNGHGTHVTGIIGGDGCCSSGKYMGMAPQCNLLPIKVLDRYGGGNIENVKRGVHWMLSQKKKYHIRILNISVGMLKHTKEREQVELIKLVEQVWEEGIVVVAAAGNNGPQQNTVTVPGICRSVITVGSSDDREESRLEHGFKRGYSGCGPTDSCIIKPEILAPGTRIISLGRTDCAYTTKSGTSMATPVVAGAIALLLDKYPDMTPKDVKLKLYNTANRNCNRYMQVWGCLDVIKLLQ